MQIERVKTSQVKLNPNNPRLIKDDKFEKLTNSIKNFPEMLEIRPVVINDHMVILGGNMRFRAAKEAGLKEIPVIKASSLTEEQQREFIIKDNVSGGEWDWDMLANEWDTEDLDAWGLDVPDEWVIEELPDEELNEDVVFGGLEDDPVSKLGDLWILGEHRVLCGDSSSVTDIERLMDGQKADMVFTDPPYGVSYVGKTEDALKVLNDDLAPEELKEKNTEWFNGVDFAIRDGAYVLATIPARPLHLIFAQDWLGRGWLRQIMVWNKDSMVLGHSEYHYKHEPILFGWKPGDRLKNEDRTKTTVWDFDRPKASRLHPTMKPIEMWVYGIEQHTNVGDLLYEPFSGSGTCLIACEKTRRKCYGMELSPNYVDVIVKRWQEYTGKDAVLESTGQTFNEVSSIGSLVVA